jgi:hypothetical protein
LDGTETAKQFLPLNSSYWRKHTSVDFTLTSERLIGNQDLIYRTVKPLSGEYIVYPHSRRDLDRVMQAIREAKAERSPTPPSPAAKLPGGTTSKVAPVR